LKYVLFYHSADDVLAQAPAHMEAHDKRLPDFEIWDRDEGLSD
jgi:hypothetical protein